MSHFLNIQNFSCGYGSQFMLTDINLQIEKGILAGIIGPNGSGKTTLFRGITGELKAAKGNIMLNNIPLHTLPVKKKAQMVSVVTQYIDPADITVEDYVLMGRLPYRKGLQFFETDEDLQVARKYLEYTGIMHLKDKNLTELSGGEQQLAEIARALTQEPQLLLLDEPTSHLDITHQVQVLNLIQKLNKELKLTVLMIIHDLNLAGEYCNYLIMMNKGSLYVQGKPEEVLTYSNIENIYKTVVITKTNPVSLKPAVFLVSQQVLDSISKK